MFVENSLSKLASEHGITEEEYQEHPMGNLKPEDWKNIPICLTEAMKLLIDHCIVYNIRYDSLSSDYNAIRDSLVANVRSMEIRLSQSIMEMDHSKIEMEKGLKRLMDRSDHDNNTMQDLKFKVESSEENSKKWTSQQLNHQKFELSQDAAKKIEAVENEFFKRTQRIEDIMTSIQKLHGIEITDEEIKQSDTGLDHLILSKIKSNDIPTAEDNEKLWG